MNARTLTRFGRCALLAALASGCGTLDRLRPAPEPAARARQPDFEPGAEPPLPALPGTVVGASGQLPAIPVAPAPQPQPQPPAPQPMPQPKFPATGLPLTPPRPLPMPLPNSGAPGTNGSGFADPNFRAWPTVSGARWELSPNEQALDRLIEITKYLDAALAQNRELLGRVRELEALGKTRDQALNEAAREIDALAPAAKDRPVLLAQIEQLRARVQKIEDEDIKLFEEILKYLNKQLPPENKP